MSNFDEDDNGQRLVVVCDDDELFSNNESKSNEELLNQRIINFTHVHSDDEESVTDNGSERDFSFKDSDEEHDFGKYN